MTTVAQRSFAGGEITPSLYARCDIEKYLTSLRTMRNMLTMRHGGATNRAGFQFIQEVKTSSKTVKLIPFIFNADQTYLLEFGDLYMRVYRDGAAVTVSGVAAYNGATAYTIGQLVVSVGINYYCIQAGTGQTPASSPLYWYPLTGSIYEIPTPYALADLAMLNYVQSADVITLMHPTYAVRELARTGHTSWTLSAVTFAPSQAAPTAPTCSGVNGTADLWKITAVKSETYEESLPTSAVGSDTVASSGSPRTIGWAAAAGAVEYNIYKKSNGDIYGFVGTSVGTTFVDNGIEADITETPPSARNPFSSSTNYPSTGVYHQQRQGYANTTTDPEKAWFSKSGNFKNFTISSPLQDDDAVTFRLNSTLVNAIKHMIVLNKLIIFTSGGEWVVKGDDAGTLKPSAINADPVSYYGCGDLRPLITGNDALYLQARGSVVRDFVNDSIEGYSSDDLTIFSAHLFDGYEIVDWTYQQTPHSIVWAVRDDGALLGFTYVRKQKMFAWHRHDTDGTFENVCAIPEGNEDALYACIKRTINGTTKRYIERMNTRQIGDIEDLILMDSALTYDGRNTGATTMTLSGSGWTHTDTLTLTSSVAYFVVGDIGKEIHLTGSDGTLIRAAITAYTDNQHVSVTPNAAVPVSMQAAAITDWGKAIKVITGLSHLEAKQVSVFGDGFVVASPYNSKYTTVTVASGSITLTQCHVVIHVGLPYISDVETLDIDTVDGETLSDKDKLINTVNLYVEDTRGIFAGMDFPTADEDDPYLEGLNECKLRELENTDDPVDLKTGMIEVSIESEWNSHGRCVVRQVDPVPMTILSIVPAGYIPFKG